jgi:STE24 endopeptidase
MAAGVDRRAALARPLAVALGAVALAAAAAWRLAPGQPGPAPVEVDVRAVLGAETVERAQEYRGPQRIIGLGATVAGLLALAAAAAGRPRRLARLLGRLGKRPLAGAAGAGALLALLVAVAELPFGLLARERAVEFGISTQGLDGWLADRGLALAIGLATAALGALLLIWLQRRLPRRWWIPGAAVVVAYAGAISFLHPVLIAPLFSDFERVGAGPARAEVERLADRAGIEVGEVLAVDASRRVTSLNAYVAGIGATKRVVLYDNLLREVERPALRAVVAHELGHVSAADIPRGLLYLALVAPLGLLAVRLGGDALAARRGVEPGTPAALPGYAFALALAALALAVPGYALSRAVEERADRYAVELTGDPRGLTSLQTRLARANLSDPDPPAWSQLLFGTHPTPKERIGIGEAYARERPGAAAGACGEAAESRDFAAGAGSDRRRC